MPKEIAIPYFNAKVEIIQRLGGNRFLNLKFSNSKMLQKYLAQFAGKAVKVSIRPVSKIRSDNQNRYYWGVVIAMIAEETGMTPDEVHEALKWKFLKQVKQFDTGVEHNRLNLIETVHSTATLKTGQFESYLAEAREFAQVYLNVKIPMPNEVDLEKL